MANNQNQGGQSGQTQGNQQRPAGITDQEWEQMQKEGAQSGGQSGKQGNLNQGGMSGQQDQQNKSQQNPQESSSKI